ncbi:hypothetical protein OIV83_001934 [Microbotryomycetes sp. JL201]|nr:hypothetical protein OIV83_001934 [Microbotryomycetes sp. JL201]
MPNQAMRLHAGEDTLYQMSVGARFESLDAFKLTLHRATLTDGVKYCVKRSTDALIELGCNWHGDPTVATNAKCPARVGCTHVDGSSTVVVTVSEMSASCHDHPVTDTAAKLRKRKLCESDIKTILTRAERGHSRGSKQARLDDRDRPKSRSADDDDEVAAQQSTLCPPVDRADVKSAFRVGAEQDSDMATKEQLAEAYPKQSMLQDEIRAWLDSEITAYLHAYAAQNSFVLYRRGGLNMQSTFERAWFFCLASTRHYQQKFSIKPCSYKIKIEKRLDGTWKVSSGVWMHSHALDRATFADSLNCYDGGSARGIFPDALWPQRESVERGDKTSEDNKTGSDPPTNVLSPHLDLEVPKALNGVDEVLMRNEHVEHNFASRLGSLLSHKAAIPRLAELAPVLLAHGVSSMSAFVDLILMTQPARFEFIKTVTSKTTNSTVKMTLIDRHLLLNVLAAFADDKGG